MIIMTLAAVPFVASAQGVANDIESLINFFSDLFNSWLIPLMISLALIYLIYAVVRYIQATEDSQGKEERKQQIFWGIVGLFVIITVWSLVAIVANTFDIFGGGSLQVK